MTTTDKLVKLITVKSIVTLLLTITVMIITMRNKITGSELLNIYTTVIAFYFGTQSARGEHNG